MASSSKEKRPQQKPKKRFKNIIKSNLKALENDVNTWEALAANRAPWRNAVYVRCEIFEKRKVEHAVLQRALRKQDVNAIPTDIQDALKCEICSRLVLSKAGMISHMKAHARRGQTTELV